MNGVLLMKANEKRNHTNDQNSCDNFHEMIEFIGKRWTGVIVYQLLDGPKRYHELLEDVPGISDRLLVERLRELEAYGLVMKRVSESSSRKVEYELTKSGKELDEVICAILKWIKENGCLTNEKK